mmetsp:Transcript_12091/g.17477  ORF Transcript_12091/g.17477 Transcript_12091/m.17477 type:complete len:223 (-) Transcript_12091:387-1055(-)
MSFFSPGVKITSGTTSTTFSTLTFSFFGSLGFLAASASAAALAACFAANLAAFSSLLPFFLPPLGAPRVDPSITTGRPSPSHGPLYSMLSTFVCCGEGCSGFNSILTLTVFCVSSIVVLGSTFGTISSFTTSLFAAGFAVLAAGVVACAPAAAFWYSPSLPKRDCSRVGMRTTLTVTAPFEEGRITVISAREHSWPINSGSISLHGIPSTLLPSMCVRISPS